MDELTDVLTAATALIPSGYFYLNIDGGDSIYRERVYCYELYHQMRVQWPPHTPYYLNGEIDKAAHPILTRLGAASSKPDLLVHRPGYMEGNHAIIEVKPARAAASGIKKDLITLSLFVNNVGYQRAIYLIYGGGAADLIPRVELAAAEIEGRAPIELWIHGAAGESAVCNRVL